LQPGSIGFPLDPLQLLLIFEALQLLIVSQLIELTLNLKRLSALCRWELGMLLFDVVEILLEPVDIVLAPDYSPDFVRAVTLLVLFSCPAVLCSCRFFWISSSAAKLSLPIRNEALNRAIENTLLLFICDQRPRDNNSSKTNTSVRPKRIRFKCELLVLPTSGKSRGYFFIHEKPSNERKYSLGNRRKVYWVVMTDRLTKLNGHFTTVADQPLRSALSLRLSPPDEGWVRLKNASRTQRIHFYELVNLRMLDT
jgi:hypothetical protein